MTTLESQAEPAARLPQPARKRRKKNPMARWDARAGLFFALPMFLLFLAFRFGPAIAGVLLSFFDYDISGTLDFKGLENFKRMLGDGRFWDSLRITLFYAVLAVPLSLSLSLAMALSVRRKFRGVGFFRSVYFLPVITSLVLAGTVFVWVFSTGGPVSTISQWMGGSGDSWLSSRIMVIPALVLVGVWSRFGYGMLILLAALQEVPRELEEAALVDGAGAWHRFRYVVFPQIKPSIFFLAVIETTVSFQVFDLIYVMTQGGPSRGSYTLVYMIYDQGFKYFDFGYAATLGVALLAVTLVIAFIQRRLLEEKD